jgi:hypothetical protein
MLLLLFFNVVRIKFEIQPQSGGANLENAHNAHHLHNLLHHCQPLEIVHALCRHSGHMVQSGAAHVPCLLPRTWLLAMDRPTAQCTHVEVVGVIGDVQCPHTEQLVLWLVGIWHLQATQQECT